MAWGVRAGHYRFLQEQGRPVPEGFLEQPDRDFRLDFVWQAFIDLSSDRQIGMAEGDIPFSAIDRYATRYGIDELDEFERFKTLIKAMDAAFLKERRPKDDKPLGERAVSVNDHKAVAAILDRKGKK